MPTRKEINMSEHWIEGIPSKLILKCSICSIRVVFDYKVGDEVWDEVVEEKYRRDVVCLSCFDKLAKKKGVNLGDCLEIVYYTGEDKTIELMPVKCYVFRALNAN